MANHVSSRAWLVMTWQSVVAAALSKALDGGGATLDLLFWVAYNDGLTHG
jgi:hypothetical protein